MILKHEFAESTYYVVQFSSLSALLIMPGTQDNWKIFYLAVFKQDAVNEWMNERTNERTNEERMN